VQWLYCFWSSIKDQIASLLLVLTNYKFVSQSEGSEVLPHCYLTHLPVICEVRCDFTRSLAVQMSPALNCLFLAFSYLGREENQSSLILSKLWCWW
jgi:hypothetical protein